MKRSLFLLLFSATLAASCCNDASQDRGLQTEALKVPTIDISADTSRQSVIAAGTPLLRQAHPSTALSPDGKSVTCIWTIGHGGNCGPMARSHDGGQTWQMVTDVPEGWKSVNNCPPLYVIRDPKTGEDKILTFARKKSPSGRSFMVYAQSTDGGESWSDFDYCLCNDSPDTLVNQIMPFTALVPIRGGAALLGATNLRSGHRPIGTGGDVIGQSYSFDGGKTWSSWKVVLDMDGTASPCEPFIIRSPKGNQLLMIIRENNHAYRSLAMTSDDEGATWSAPWRLSAAVTLDRHEARYLPDGRLLVLGRDVSQMSPAHQHLTAWIGTYDDLLKGRDGQYRIKLLHSYHGSVEYPGIEVLPDGTVLATTSLCYRPGENYSVVCTRFNIEDTDRLYRRKVYMMDRPTTVPTADISEDSSRMTVLSTCYGRIPSPQLEKKYHNKTFELQYQGKTLSFSTMAKPGDPGRVNRPGISVVLNSVIALGDSVIFDPGVPYLPSKPFVMSSPDGNQLLLLCRDEYKSAHSWMMTSDDGGKSWSEPRQTNDNITLDGHSASYTPDGRLIVVGKDDRSGSHTRFCTVAWVGTYDDIINARDGQYRICVQRSYNASANVWSLGYPCIEVDPDGLVSVTNVINQEGSRGLSEVCTRFRLEETDRMISD